MEPTEIAGKIREFFLETYPHDGIELTDTTDLLNEWFVDSLGVVLTVTFLEEEFNIEMCRADIQPHVFRSIETITQLVLRRLPGEPA